MAQTRILLSCFCFAVPLLELWVAVQTRLTRQLKEARAEWRAAKEDTSKLQAEVDMLQKQQQVLTQG